MLNIIWGRENLKDLVPRFVLDPRIWFSDHKQPEWFEDPFVKKFLKSVDNTTVLFEEALKDYKGRGISTEMISTGCKTLCCIFNDRDNHIFYGSAMGDNCLPFLVEMAKGRNITIMLEHYADFPPEAFEEKVIVCNGEVLTQDTYDDSFSAWSASTQEEGYFDRVLNSGV